MDPNANLKEQAGIISYGSIKDTRLRELREALAEWLERGGFKPEWLAYPRASGRFFSWYAKHKGGRLDV